MTILCETSTLERAYQTPTTTTTTNYADFERLIARCALISTGIPGRGLADARACLLSTDGPPDCTYTST